MANTEHLYFNAFNQIPQIGSVRFRRLLNHFPNLETAWQAGPGELLKSGLEESVVQTILQARRDIDPHNEFEKLEKNRITLVAHPDASYPKLLREIPNPPMVLYLHGSLEAAHGLTVAIVGTRKYTSYGRQVVEDLVAKLVQSGIAIVSGLAFGIDALAHDATLEHKGRTLAVMASGVDSIYPASNRLLAEKIIQSGGALLSELPLGTPPLKHHFPNRNRIISGLALGTVVVEAGVESGSLITARHALEQNRQVFAVPGSIYSPYSQGPNNLIKMGAKAVTSAADILEELNLEEAAPGLKTLEIVPDNEEEQKILSVLTREPRHFNEIVKLAALGAATAAATLTIMEMKGKVRNLGGNQYIISR